MPEVIYGVVPSHPSLEQQRGAAVYVAFELLHRAGEMPTLQSAMAVLDRLQNDHKTLTVTTYWQLCRSNPVEMQAWSAAYSKKENDRNGIDSITAD